MTPSGAPRPVAPQTEPARTARARHRAAVTTALASHDIALAEVIGRGSAATVHRGHLRGRGTVVVKVARPGSTDAVDLVRREAEVLRRLPRLDPWPAAAPVPFVAQLVAEVHHRDVAALVTTPCGEGTLGARMLGASRAPDLGRRLALAQRLVAAVHALHGIGVTHGDLSPANIVLVGAQPVLIDLATACVDGTCDPMARGTLPYAAPELLHGAVPSVRSDLFAVARIVMALLSDTPADGRRGVPGPDAGVTRPPLQQVLEACTATDPSERPADLTALADAVALERARRSASRSAGRVAAAPPAPAPASATATPRPAATRDDATPTRPFGLRPPPPRSPRGAPRSAPPGDRPWWRRAAPPGWDVAQAGGRRASTAGSSTPIV